MEDYWQYSGGITIDEAKVVARAHGFALEIGRVSRFDNARGVVIARADLQGDLLNKLLLAEEIQHGLDRARAEASQALLRGLSLEEFHAELFERILLGREQGRFRFLTDNDAQAIKALIQRLWSKKR